METHRAGQVTARAAEVYESFFVPALFREPAVKVAELAHIRRGDAVLDVACGTGVLTREVAARALPGGEVVGLDRNTGMLAVARELGGGIEWHAAPAEALPFADARFDAVVSQFGLMFFDDRAGAVREMARVARDGARLTVAVWDAVERSPGYARLIAILARLFGERVADELRAPFALGDPAKLVALFAEAGLVAGVQRIDATARFASLETWIQTDVKGWTLADVLDDAQVDRLQEAAARELGDLVAEDRTVAFAAPALVATAVRPAR